MVISIPILIFSFLQEAIGNQTVIDGGDVAAVIAVAAGAAMVAAVVAAGWMAALLLLILVSGSNWRPYRLSGIECAAVTLPA